MPVPHPHVHWHAQFASHALRLQTRDPGQGRASNQRIAMLHLAYHRLSHRPPARDVLQELGNVVDPLGAAVRDQQNGRFTHHFLAAVADELNSCTKSARLFTLSTGVSGKMPWPRLKMCPGRLSASRRMCSARCFTSLHEANNVTGSKFPCTA